MENEDAPPTSNIEQEVPEKNEIIEKPKKSKKKNTKKNKDAKKEYKK